MSIVDLVGTSEVEQGLEAVPLTQEPAEAANAAPADGVHGAYLEYLGFLPTGRLLGGWQL